MNTNKYISQSAQNGSKGQDVAMINAKIDDAFERFIEDALSKNFDLFGQERDKPGFGMCGAT